MLDDLKSIIKRLNELDVAGDISPAVSGQPVQPVLPKVFSVSRQIIAVTNQKGGCAKTTTAVNLAGCLAERGFRVLVIDLDPQAHASLGLGLDKDSMDRTIYDVLMNNVSLCDVISKTQVEGLDAVPSNSVLSGAQLELATVLGRESVLRIAVRKMLLKKDYDFIIFDCNPSLNLVTINALVAADSILIPIQTHYYSLEGMKELFSTIDIVRERLNPDLQILGILATLYDTRTKISAKMLEQIRGYFKGMVFNTVIRNNVKLCEAPIFKKPIHVYDSRSLGARDYFCLADEIVAKTQKCEVRIDAGKVA
ncbi:MAG: AAA family ATPase [Candidatus Omnitrophica bacterium]|nr:AAA family ATPase [Candidatus Omnitrophota bacterium]MDD5737860.1 AAA family ATPase [Candidatus Omnitrophota bacterium]